MTEEDHDAVDWLYEMGVIAPHHLRLANEAFARHREQTERQSADRIEALEAENERLRKQLSAIGPHLKVDPSAIYPQSGGASARAALGEKE